jgi:hypothetical protein
VTGAAVSCLRLPVSAEAKIPMDNTNAEFWKVVAIMPPQLALAQLPEHLRGDVLVRTDSGGGTHAFLTWLTAP